MIFFKICMLKNTGMEYEIQVIASFPGQFLKLIFVTVCKNDHKYLGANTVTRHTHACTLSNKKKQQKKEKEEKGKRKRKRKRKKRKIYPCNMPRSEEILVAWTAKRISH
uniref:Uncharacterized protein n=1 Tax=Mustela putorius furo TaxID=9669 RepID=M3YUA8_MUSPF